MTKVVTGALLLVAFVLGLALGRTYFCPKKGEATAAALRLQVETKAGELQTALDVLSLLDEGKSVDAKALLEGQVQSSLVMVKAVAPTVDLPRNTASRIDQSVAEGEAYARGHGIDVP
ncbi:hypothetical protein [Lysobacter terrae]